MNFGATKTKCLLNSAVSIRLRSGCGALVYAEQDFMVKPNGQLVRVS